MECKYCGGITSLFWVHKNRASVIRTKTYRCESCYKTQKVHTDRFGRPLSKTADEARYKCNVCGEEDNNISCANGCGFGDTMELQEGEDEHE